MRNAIAALRPRFVLIENVAAHLGRGFGAVLADLDALGFDAEWSVVSACSVGASHMRRRLFAIAYANSDSEPAFAFDAEMGRLSSVTGLRGHWGLPAADDVGADDGIPNRMDRLVALGNAVVPQVAEQIGKMLVAA